MVNRPIFYCFTAALLSYVAYAGVSTRVHLRDSNELLGPVEVNETSQYIDYGDIMVGTELAIILESDTAIEDGMWSLYLEDDSRYLGGLYGRGPELDGFPDSIFEAAGFGAQLWFLEFYLTPENKDVSGFEMYTGIFDVTSGDWFVIDYNSVDIGVCNVAFYWWDGLDHGLIYDLRFTHVRTRDFDSNYKVDFGDYSILAGYWYQGGCSAPGWCEGADLDTSGTVDINDLALFAEYWLVKTR